MFTVRIREGRERKVVVMGIVFRGNFSRRALMVLALLGLSAVSARGQYEYNQLWDMPAEDFAELMEKRSNWSDHCPYLLRYYSPLLNPVAREIAERGTNEQKPYGLWALMHQGDDRAATRELAFDLLRSNNPMIRDAAAEYLRRHAMPEDVQGLLRFYKTERDAYVKATIRAAGLAVERRQRLFAGEPPKPDEDQPTDLPIAADLPLEEALAALEEDLSWENRRQALAALRAGNREPPYMYKTAGGPGVQKAAEQRAEVLLRITGFHPEFLREEWQQFRDALDNPPEDPPPAARLIEPLRDFSLRHYRSYGAWTGYRNSPFSGSYHIGDDSAWFADGAPVIAIGEGVVRYARPIVRSWGGIVIIEHRTARGRRFCSLYAHLGPLLAVADGQFVERGQFIGVLGRGFTAFNGGYAAHLHFGIHEGPLLQPGEVGAVIPWPDKAEKSWTRAKVLEVTETHATIRLESSGEEKTVKRNANWITGYMGKDRFENGHHRWRNPDKFLQAFTNRTVEL